MATQVTLKISPETGDSLTQVHTKVVAEAKEALREADKTSLLNSGEIKISQLQTFPDPNDPTVQIIIQVATQVGLDVVEKIIIPKLQELFHIDQKDVKPVSPPEIKKG